MSRFKKIFLISVLIVAALAICIIINASSTPMTIGLMGNAEQGRIVNIRFVEDPPAGDTIKITVGNSGSGSIAIIRGYTNEIKATNINSEQAFIIPKRSSQEITLTFPNGTLVYGTYQTVKLMTAAGNNIVYSLTYNSTCASQYDPLKDDISPTPSAFHDTQLSSFQERNSYVSKVSFVFLVLTAIANVGACLLANYAIGPRNKKERFMLLVLVTLIVVFVSISIVSPILFPPMTLG